MITFEMTKSQFVVEILNRDVQNIFKAQQLIAEQNIRLQGKDLKRVKGRGRIGTRSGALLNAVQNPKFNIVSIGDKAQVQAYIPLHMRFLDMKKLGNWKIYNRQLFGILYRNSMRDIRYGYGRQLYDFLGNELSRAFDDAKK